LSGKFTRHSREGRCGGKSKVGADTRDKIKTGKGEIPKEMKRVQRKEVRMRSKEGEGRRGKVEEKRIRNGKLKGRPVKGGLGVK